MQAGWPPPRHSGPWMPIYSPLRSSGSFLLIDAGRGLREIPHVRPKPTPAARHTRTRARTLAWELSCPGPGCARRSAGGRHAGIRPQGPARARTRSRPGPGVRETLAGSLLFLGSWRVWAGASRRLGQDRGTGGVQAAEDACKAFPKLPICRPRSRRHGPRRHVCPMTPGNSKSPRPVSCEVRRVATHTHTEPWGRWPDPSTHRFQQRHPQSREQATEAPWTPGDISSDDGERDLIRSGPRCRLQGR